jgi:hypothetical protein
VAYLGRDAQGEWVRKRRAADRAHERAERAAERKDPAGLRIALSQLEARLRERAAYPRDSGLGSGPLVDGRHWR